MMAIRFLRPARSTLAMLALSALALSPLASTAQSRISRDEAAQLYAAAGFRIVNNQPVNACGKVAKPRVSFVDINADKRPEALFVDADAGCYAPSGRYFAVLVKEGSRWRALLSGAGAVQALPGRSGGWLDMRVSNAGCEQPYRYDGRVYAPAGGCSGQPLAVAQRSADPAQAQAQAQARVGNAAPVSTLSAADEAAAFKAAGFTRRGKMWRSGCDDPGTASYEPGSVAQVADLNGDGLPDAVLTEGGTYCYGNTGQGFWLVSRGANGRWALITHNTGMPEFLPSKGVAGWPDISVGGPGFCFPVQRWNGKEYKLQRWAYEGKACKPPR